MVNNSSLTCDAAIKNDIFNGLNGKWNYSVITDKDYINADSKIKVKVTPTETDYFTGEAVSSEMTLQQKVIASTDLSVEYVGDSYTYSGTAVTLKKEDFKITDKLSGATVDSKYISTIKADGTNTSVSNAGEYTAKVNFTIGTDGLVNYKLSSADTETTDFAATNKWVINKLDLSTCEVFLGEIQGNTTGTPITSANLSKITIKKDGKIVANEVPLAGSGFVISNVQTNTGTPGTYTATVQTTATSSNYTGTSTTATFRISQNPLSTATFEGYTGHTNYVHENETYTGEAVTKDASKLGNLKIGTTVLTKGIDYEAEFVYSDNVNAGTAKLIVVGKGTYAGSVKEFTFQITPAVISNTNQMVQDRVSYVADSTMKAEEYKPAITVKAKNSATPAKEFTLTEGTDYTVSYEYNNKPAGNIIGNSIKVIIKVTNKNFIPVGNNYVTYTEYVAISKKQLTDVSVTPVQASYTYTGEAIVPELIVKDGDTELEKGVDYKIQSISSNTSTSTI